MALQGMTLAAEQLHGSRPHQMTKNDDRSSADRSLYSYDVDIATVLDPRVAAAGTAAVKHLQVGP